MYKVQKPVKNKYSKSKNSSRPKSKPNKQGMSYGEDMAYENYGVRIKGMK